MANQEIMQMIHSVNPYADFDYRAYPEAVEGWYSEDNTFNRLIDEINPALIVEIGTWKGASAIYMAKYLKEKNIDATILCIDTWLGSVDFWTDHHDKEKYLSLNLIYGYPSVYYQFLANVLHNTLQEYIVPFPQSSLEAWRWLDIHKMTPDICYIDASHNRDDVINDLNNYWAILKPGGALFGDDYDEYWPTVKSAVDTFSSELKVDPEIIGNKWILRKTREAGSRGRILTQQQHDVEMVKTLQTVQHDYLQYQKMHCRMRDDFAENKTKYRESLEKRLELLEKYELLREKYRELDQSQSILLWRKVRNHRGLAALAKIIFQIIKPILGLK